MSDLDLRLRAFDWLRERTERHGDVLSWALLLNGFRFRGRRVPLLSQQGIFKPAAAELPVSIRTSPDGPYSDGFGPDGLLRYDYRGDDPQHRDNAGLREAMWRELPLVYFHGIVSGRYLAVWPVYLVGDDPASLTFSVAVDDASVLSRARLRVEANEVADEDPEPRRRYVTALTRRRVHQRTFRERVLRAYREQCAFCSLRHTELLDAAHIVPDREEEGEPVVRNGMALCKLHHAAYDSFFLAVHPTKLRIVVRADILEEEDGPMLLHGLQGLSGREIHRPRNAANRPDPALLASRYERFRSLGPRG